jgi:hypothetical protein
MTPTVATSQPARPPVPRKRWWLRGLLIGVALLILTPLALVSYSNLGARGAWAEAEAEADRDDPHWRLLDLEAERPQYADTENSALHIIATVRKGGRVSIGIVPNYDQIFEKLPANAQLNAQQVQLIRTEMAKMPRAIEDARKLKDMPGGRFPLTYNDDWISTLIPHHHDARVIAEWMEHDAWLLAQEGDIDGAIESCQAIINGGRSMKDDAMLITCLVRIAMQNIALNTLERVLAQGEADEAHLLAMQKMLEREIDEPSFVRGMRGERGGIHHLFTKVRDGKVKGGFGGLMGSSGGNVPGIDPVTGWLTINYPSTMLRHYPDHLRFMNREVAAAKAPLHERGAKMAELQAELVRSRNPITKLLGPATNKVEEADRRSQIYLRSMVVVLACERYRQKDEEKRWPRSLDDLVKAKVLEAVPADPMDNQPLRYRITKVGVVVYSIGFDNTDDHGNINRDQWRDPGVDMGFQLWEVHLRRQIPLPPIGLPGLPKD